MFKKSINSDKPIHSHNQKPVLKNPIIKTAIDVKPNIRTVDMIKLFILSKTLLATGYVLSLATLA